MMGLNGPRENGSKQRIDVDGVDSVDWFAPVYKTAQFLIFLTLARKDELSLIEFQKMLETKELRELFQAGCPQVPSGVASVASGIVEPWQLATRVPSMSFALGSRCGCEWCWELVQARAQDPKSECIWSQEQLQLQCVRLLMTSDDPPCQAPWHGWDWNLISSRAGGWMVPLERSSEGWRIGDELSKTVPTRSNCCPFLRDCTRINAVLRQKQWSKDKGWQGSIDYILSNILYIYVYIILYHKKFSLRACLTSVLHMQALDLAVLMADNSRMDAKLDWLCHLFEVVSIQILASNVNMVCICLHNYIYIRI